MAIEDVEAEKEAAKCIVTAMEAGQDLVQMHTGRCWTAVSRTDSYNDLFPSLDRFAAGLSVHVNVVGIHDSPPPRQPCNSSA